MLNYIWAGLILFSLIFALSSDVTDLRNHTYANGTPLVSTVTYRNASDQDSREAAVDVRIEPTEYAHHFNATESLAATYPATLVRMENGSLLRFGKDANLPPRFAAMRDFSD